MRPAIAALLTGCAVFGQTLSFDAATIKLNNSGHNAIGGRGVCFGGGRVSVSNIPLSVVIEQAYGVKEFQIVGRPSWLTTERYDIEAKAGATVSRDDCHQMVRTLLEDRMKLAAHRETRQLPVYRLVLAKGGARMRNVEAGAPLGIKTFNTTTGELTTRGTSMAQLAGMLAMTGELDNLVIDATGLEGNFEFDLKWTPEARVREGESGPTLFAALQEQLGVKLEAGKGPVEVLVIDHVERVPVEQ